MKRVQLLNAGSRWPKVPLGGLPQPGAEAEQDEVDVLEPDCGPTPDEGLLGGFSVEGVQQQAGDQGDRGHSEDHSDGIVVEVCLQLVEEGWMVEQQPVEGCGDSGQGEAQEEEFLVIFGHAAMQTVDLNGQETDRDDHFCEINCQICKECLVET